MSGPVFPAIENDTQDYKSLKVDSSGALIVTGSTGGGAESLKIKGATDDIITSTDVAGKKSLDVNVTDIIITHQSDSIKIGDGTSTITSTLVGSKQALDVNAVNENDLKTLIDEVDASNTYVGYATVGASTGSSVWKIKKIVVSGTVTSVLYADGDSNYDNSWNSRASLSYS